MSDPVCGVCGEQVPPKTLRGKNLDAGVTREQEELLTPALVRALADGKRLTLCHDRDSNWVWVHPTDADAPAHRDRNLSTRQVDRMADRLDGWYGHDIDEEGLGR